MRRIHRLTLWLAALALLLAAEAGAQQAPGDPKRGQYVLWATGGCSCHTDYKNDGAVLAGRRPIKTPFGTAYGSNITPHDKTGLGQWSEADFVRAMTLGVGLNGKELFPFFPYTSYTRMTAADLHDLWAYLRTVRPVDLPNREHDLRPPFNMRSGIKLWKAVNFSPQPFRPEPARSETWNRGYYLVTVLGHCAECHTPRNMMGALKSDMAYAGSVDGPEGQAAPNLTPDRDTGLGDWSEADIVYYLQMGLRPDGDSSQGLMAELIEHGYSKLAEADLRAIAMYVKDLKPIRNLVEKKKQ